VSTGGRRPSRAARCAAPFTPEGRPRTLRGTQRNSGGEAATFPKALDTTNKEESIWTDQQSLVMVA
jgi:hypothetical protein